MRDHQMPQTGDQPAAATVPVIVVVPVMVVTVRVVMLVVMIVPVVVVPVVVVVRVVIVAVLVVAVLMVGLMVMALAFGRARRVFVVPMVMSRHAVIVSRRSPTRLLLLGRAGAAARASCVRVAPCRWRASRSTP